MSFRDCISEAVRAGALAADEGDALIRRYEDRVRANAGKPDPQSAAKAELESELSAEAARKKRLADLSGERIAEIADFARNYRKGGDGPADILEAFEAILENRNNRLAGAPSVVGRRDASKAETWGRLEGLLFDFRRKFGLGKRRNAMRMENMVDEAFGVGTGDSMAREFLTAWRQAADTLVDRFNAAGGDMLKMADYFPQSHDARRVLAAKQKPWKDFIRDRLDIAKMKDPLTGGAMTPARLDESLDAIWRRIVTDGGIDREPTAQPFGRGALANQRADERFLQFKDAAAWRDYNAAFGKGDVFETLRNHVDGLAKDVAALEILGPNPNATVEWMRQAVQSEAAKKQVGEASLFAGDVSINSGGRIAAGDEQLARMWRTINGSAPAENMAVADAFSALRSFTRLNALSGTMLTALAGDPFQQKVARKFAGVPAMRYIGDLAGQVFSGASRRDLMRAGVLLQHEMDNISAGAREAGLFSKGAEYTRWLEDRVFQATGLTPWTKAGQATAAKSFMFEAGDRTGQSLADMAKDGANGARFARWLRGFGIDEAQWDMIRTAKPLEHGEAGGMLRMMDVLDAADAANNPAMREAAYRYGEAVHAFMEEAVPQGTNRARSKWFMGQQQRGNMMSELAGTMTMFWSYPVTVLTSLMRATGVEAGGSRGRGAAYFGGALITLTIGGMIMMTIRELMKGRDPPDFTDWKSMGEAMAKGGGFGVYGDYLFGNYERGSTQQLARFAGPVFGLGVDVAALGNLRGIVSGDEDTTSFTKRATKFGQRYTPVQNMWWLRPASQRLLWDQIDWMADPQAHRAWRRAERKLENDEGQGTWWGRGEATPRRMPEFSNMWGGE